MDLSGVTPIVLPQSSNATPVILIQSSTLIWTQLSFIVGLIVLIFAVANFLKLRKPTLKLDICEDESKTYIPKITRICFENLSDAFIQDLEISWELYLNDEDLKVASSHIVFGVIFGPRNKVEATIPLIKIFQKIYKSFGYLPTYTFGEWFPGDIYLVLKYKYRFYKLVEHGSFHFKWNLEFYNWDPDRVKKSNWEQLLKKTRVKYWWQFWMDGSPSLYSPTPDECAELKQKLKTELDEKVRKKEKEIEEMLKKIEKK